MHLITLIAAGYAAYGPPSNRDAYDAYTARILEPLYEYGDILREPEIRAGADFPSEVTLQRCENRTARAIQTQAGLIEISNGYECIQEIRLNGADAYRNVGFYRHQGLEWEYYGPVQETLIPSLREFYRPRVGVEIEKPGALSYDGAPSDPLNERYKNPYADLLNQLNSYSPY